MTASALGEDGVLGVQFHAQLEVVAGLTVFAHAEVAGGHALDRAVLVVEHFGRSKARENLHAQGLGLFTQPFAHSAQADDVAAVVVEVARHEPVRRALLASLGQDQEVVAGHGLVQRGAALFPVGEEFGDGAWVHDRTRQNVRAGLGAFFEHADVDLLAAFGGDLLQSDGGGQASGAAADDDDVVFHGFAGTVGAQDVLWAHGERFMKGCAEQGF